MTRHDVIECQSAGDGRALTLAAPAWLYDLRSDWVALYASDIIGGPALVVIGDGTFGINVTPHGGRSAGRAADPNPEAAELESGPLRWGRVDQTTARTWIDDATHWTHAAPAVHDVDEDYLTIVLAQSGSLDVHRVRPSAVRSASQIWQAENILQSVPEWFEPSTSELQALYRVPVLRSILPGVPCRSATSIDDD